MSLHIGAEPGAIAPTVLMPGDPLRARWVAQNFLEKTECYSQVRGMFGYTGVYQGHTVSVQGSGMGQPSLAIYAHELFEEYAVQRVIRVGSCGALAEGLELGDLVLASAACTDSAMNRLRFGGIDYAPVADFELLTTAHAAARAREGVNARVGLLFSTDSFYNPREDLVAPLVQHGVLAVEMETSALYTIAASYQRRALSVCTVSDDLVNGEQLSAQEREEGFEEMARVALAATLSD